MIYGRLHKKHKDWGLGLYAVDPDFVLVEYAIRGGSPMLCALVEYKSEFAELCRPSSPNVRVMVALASRANLPMFGVRYLNDFSRWTVRALNQQAENECTHFASGDSQGNDFASALARIEALAAETEVPKAKRKPVVLDLAEEEYKGFLVSLRQRRPERIREHRDEQLHQWTVIGDRLRLSLFAAVFDAIAEKVPEDGRAGELAANLRRHVRELSLAPVKVDLPEAVAVEEVLDAASPNDAIVSTFARMFADDLYERFAAQCVDIASACRQLLETADVLRQQSESLDTREHRLRELEDIHARSRLN